MEVLPDLRISKCEEKTMVGDESYERERIAREAEKAEGYSRYYIDMERAIMQGYQTCLL